MLLARRAGALERYLKRAAAGEPRGIHQARVASRRLREAVPVLAAGLDGVKAGKARRKVRRVTRALGAIRELDVTVSLVDELARRETLPRLALEQVRARVVAERDRRQVEVTKRLARVNTDKLARRLATLGAALAAAGSEPWRETLAARLAKRAKRLERAVDGAGRMYGAERLHAVRIAVKKLRYAAEVAVDTGAPAAGPVRTLKRMQDLLGRLHDLQVLETHVAAVQAAPRSGALPDGGLAIIGRALEDECRHLHARYLSGVPDLLAASEAVRHEIVSQVARGSGRRRPLKMALPGPGSRSATRAATVRPGRQES